MHPVFFSGKTDPNRTGGFETHPFKNPLRLDLAFASSLCSESSFSIHHIPTSYGRAAHIYGLV